MAPPRLELGNWEDQIRSWQRLGVTHSQMRTQIEEATDTRISASTWGRRLREMGIQTKPPVLDTVELRTRIAYLFSALRLTDADTIDVLARDGFTINTRALARIRKDMGLRKSTSREDFEAVDEQLRALLKQELDMNTISGFGEGNLYTYMRSKYNVIGK